MAKADRTRKQLPDFGPAIDDATMKQMERGAASNERGQQRRLVLVTMARDKDVLVKFAKDEPESFAEVAEMIESFKDHAKALLDVAESALDRMAVAAAQAKGVGHA